MTSKRYLVTGGTGFIGSALVRELCASGRDEIAVLDDGSRGRWDRLHRLSLRRCEADVRNYESVSRSIRGGHGGTVDAVIHLAAVNGTRHFYEKPFEVLDVGVQGTLNVVRACREYGIKELHVASSSEAYQTPLVIPTPEEVALVVPDPLNPRYSYGGSKIIAELLALHSGIPRVTVFRPHNVYGPDMGNEHVIPELIAKVRVASKNFGAKLEIKGSGTQTRAFCYIDDFIRGLMLVIEKGEGIYNIGTDQLTAISFLAAWIARRLNVNAELVPSEAPAGETNTRCPDITKLRTLGYEPKVRLADGLEKTIEWYVRQVPHA
jgi:UDP-glucose 4-epimerase